jgi:ribokinase
MASVFLGKGRVAMIGITVRDPFGLWRIPYDALVNSGVVIDFVIVQPFDPKNPRFPGVALIPVDKNGNNQIYVLPGVNESLSAAHIGAADKLFSAASAVLVMAMEIPRETAACALGKAHGSGMRVVIDPGGIAGPEDILDLLDGRVFLVKPNEHEARLITGVAVDGFKAAGRAAEFIRRRGVRNVMITHGAYGAYLFTEEAEAVHIPVPEVNGGTDRDETGCGDQTTAVLAALTAEGMDICKAARLAVEAGTLQYHRLGIQPVQREELSGGAGG